MDPEIQKYLKTAESLPQWSRVDPANFDRWIGAILNAGPSSLTPERHLERMAGLTGTQTPVIIQEKRGLYDPFGETIRSLVEEKLFLGLPKKQTAHMGRGVRWEPYIRDMFLSESGAVTDEESLSLLRQSKGCADAEFPWLIGTPDDVVILDGKRYIIDYKSPLDAHTSFRDGKVVPEVFLRYAIQVHHYQLIARFLGIPVDGRMIVFPDMERNLLISHPVPEDETIFRDILNYGTEIWNGYVLSGTVPEGPAKPACLSGESARGIAELAEKYSFFKKMNSLTFDCINSLRDEIMTKVLHQGVHQGRVALKGVPCPLSISIKPDFDIKKLADYFSFLGMDLPLVPGKKYRTARMVAELAYAGSKPEELELLSDAQLADRISAIGQDPDVYREKEIDIKAVLVLFEEWSIDPSQFADFSATFRSSTSGPGGATAERIHEWARNMFSFVEQEVDGARTSPEEEKEEKIAV